VENVDRRSIKIDREKSTLTFRAKPGKSLAPRAIHAALKPTRLGKNAGSVLSYFRLTAVGPITGEKELRLKVRGTDLEFVLADDPEGKPDKGGRTLLQHLRSALARSPGDVQVTGYLDGWKGRFPEVLKKGVPPVPVLQVIDFRIGKDSGVTAPDEPGRGRANP
jgi:hypothetical protein